MHDITVEYTNHVKSRIKTNSKAVFQAIRKEFSFEVDGYQYTPAYKQGIWDGRINLIDGKGYFYGGLVKRILKYCDSHNLSIKVNDLEEYLPKNISMDDIQYLFDYCKFTPYDYQQNAVKKALSIRKLLILSPTSCLDPDTEIEVYIKPKTN